MNVIERIEENLIFDEISFLDTFLSLLFGSKKNETYTTAFTTFPTLSMYRETRWRWNLL
jgi:hypothetical protein